MNHQEQAQIANTIFQQLGGNRFVVMTGARSVSREGATLIVKLPTPAGLRAFGFNVTLNPMDLYNVTFVRLTRAWDVQRNTIENIYADQLKSIIETETGLRLSL